MDGEEIDLFATGPNARLHLVDDAVTDFLWPAQTTAANGQVFNVGAIEPVSLARVGRPAHRDSWFGQLYRLIPFRPSEGDRHRLDLCRRSQDPACVEVASAQRLREGLARTISFYRANRAQYWAAPCPAEVREGSPAEAHSVHVWRWGGSYSFRVDAASDVS